MSILLDARDLTHCFQLLNNVTTPLMDTLMAYRNYFIEVAKQADALYSSSKKVVEALSKETIKELARLQKHPPPQKSIQKIEKKSEPIKPAIIQPSRTSVKIPCNKIQPIISIKMTKELQQATSRTQKWFFCFQCFRQRNEKKLENNPYSWKSEVFYLSHLKKKHSIVPNFQVALLSLSGIPFSHAYFHGQLVSLFRNSPIQEYLQILACYQQEAKSKIYICACITEENEGRSLTDEPIFINSSLFLEHITLSHDGVCPNDSSHKLCKYGKEKINYFRSNKNEISKHPRMVSIIRDIEETIEEATRNSITSFLVQANPLCRLEIISRLGLTWIEAFQSLPENSSAQPTLNELKGYLSKQKNKAKLVKIEHLSDEENELINLQISLLNPNLFICGQCSQRSDSQQEFISHIYMKHRAIHHLNSHQLLFLS